jgi:peroxiredoxin
VAFAVLRLAELILLLARPNMFNLIVAFLAILFTGSIALAQADEPAATQPATQAAPSTQAAATPAIPDDVKPLLDQLNESAAALKSIQLAGRITFHFESADDKQQHTGEFTSAFRAPAMFRHEAKDDLLIVSGVAKDKGQSKGYAFVPARNAYAEFDPPQKQGLDQVPDQVARALAEQDPMLFLLMSGGPGKQLLDGTTDVKRAADVQLDDKPHPAISFVEGPVTYRVAFDPATHLVRQVQVDQTRRFKDRGVDDVKVAILTIDYTKISPDATTDDGAFSFEPPKEAVAMKLPATTDEDDAAPGGGGGGEGAAMALVGKPAPGFTLKDLQGKPVALAQLKGHVVVLDFWATWCGPCVASLPHLDKLYQDKSAAGVQVFAVNQNEAAPVVRKFIESKHLTMPVLLDGKGDVGKKYSVEGIPQTVVIGKDGKIKKVIIGFGGDDQELRAAVDKAVGG